MKRAYELLEKIRLRTKFEVDDDIFDGCLLTAAMMCMIIGICGILSVLIN